MRDNREANLLMGRDSRAIVTEHVYEMGLRVHRGSQNPEVFLVPDPSCGALKGASVGDSIGEVVILP
jgi:hypothetical protein